MTRYPAPEAAWTLSHLASFGTVHPANPHVATLAAAGFVIATPNGWALSPRGFAALTPLEQERLRTRYTPPTRAEAAMWRRLEAE